MNKKIIYELKSKLEFKLLTLKYLGIIEIANYILYII